MKDYSKGKIYKIVCNETGLIYIGSTIQALSERLRGHKNKYKEWLNKKRDYTSSFKILENDNYNIILIENYECKCKDELRARERYWQDQIKCVNIQKAFTTNEEKKKQQQITDKEYRKNNIDKYKKYQKEYYKNNIDNVKKKVHEWYKETNYYEKNKVLKKEKSKEYYNNNKNIILEKHKEKIQCECGSIINKSDLNKHLKSIKHNNFINLNV